MKLATSGTSDTGAWIPYHMPYLKVAFLMQIDSMTLTYDPFLSQWIVVVGEVRWNRLARQIIQTSLLALLYESARVSTHECTIQKYFAPEFENCNVQARVQDTATTTHRQQWFCRTDETNTRTMTMACWEETKTSHCFCARPC